MEDHGKNKKALNSREGSSTETEGYFSQQRPFSKWEKNHKNVKLTLPRGLRINLNKTE